jgi:uncharacterized protein (DUF2141 family)
MNRVSVESALFLTPQLTTAPTLHWHGEEMTITLSTKLQPMRTYTVTVGSGARDLHANIMTTSYTFAFTTGHRIDNGKITGYVSMDNRPAAGSLVWVYDLNRLSTPNPSQDTPDYRTQTGSRGEYLLTSLTWSSYRPFAIHDRNGDGQYTPETDPIAVPSHDALLREMRDQLTMNDLVMVVRDTTGERVRPSAIADTLSPEPSEKMLGTISGTIQIQNRDDPSGEAPLCYLSATSTEETDKHAYSVSHPLGSYEWKLPSGRYRLSAFLDKNQNTIYDTGRPFPFIPSEPFRSLPDTILVRARWETRGIDFIFNR